jgi:protein-tyrosine-phosphatase
MPHILVVCTANICRSPVAEAFLRDRLSRQGLTGWTVSSAGTWAEPGRPAAQFSRILMARQGINLDQHRARLVEEADLAQAHLVLTMEPGHAEALRVEFPHYASKVFLFSEMIGLRFSIADPYGGPLTGYQRMIDELEKLVDEGLPRIVELVQERTRPQQTGQ